MGMNEAEFETNSYTIRYKLCGYSRGHVYSLNRPENLETLRARISLEYHNFQAIIAQQIQIE